MSSTLSCEPLVEDRVRILVVDDSPENLVSLETVLEGLGQDLVLAQSGKEALWRLLDDDYAAILLDVEMPEMDGFQTAELIRTRKRSRNTPILFLTAYKSDEHLFPGYDLGAVDFVFKPIVPEILRSKVAVFVEFSRNMRLLRRQAEELEKTEQKFRSLLEAAPDAMIISSEDGEIVGLNTQAELMFGLSREDLAGRNIRLLIPDWNALACVGEAVLPGPLRELNALRRGGQEFPAEINISPLGTGEGVLLISGVRSIAERKHREDEIRELNALLEQRVAVSTGELRQSNEALRHSNEALRQSNDDLKQFAYAASHDLQEPLRMIALYSGMISRKYSGKLDREADQFIGYILSGAQRMELLLKDLLTYSQAGSSVGPVALVDCQEVMRRVLLNLQAAIEENGASITWSELPTLEAQEIRLVQLFQNLVSNAIKYRRAEPPRIRISAERHEPDWLFCVEDNGIGIRPEYAQQVFGIFKRLHGQTYPGTGIGLAICQRIVERYGGRIWVDSKPGEGSRFYFTLRCAMNLPAGNAA